MADHDMGWPNQGRESPECTEATRSLLASRGFWLTGAVCMALWVIFYSVVTA